MKSNTKIFIALVIAVLSLVSASDLYGQETDVKTLIKQAQKSGIQQHMLTELQDRAQQRGASNQQLSTILETAISMSKENLPADVAVQKSLEGFSKGIPTNRIVAVVQQMHQSLGQAAKIVDPWMKKSTVQAMLNRTSRQMPRKEFRNELTKAASKSIMQHIPAETVQNVLSQIGDKTVMSHTGPTDIVAAMGILPDLPEAADSRKSGAFVVRALKGGFKADALQQLPSALKMAQHHSQLPAASVMERVGKQMQKGVPARQILQNLFNGKMGGGPPGQKPKGLDHNPGRGNGHGKGHGNGHGNGNG